MAGGLKFEALPKLVLFEVYVCGCPSTQPLPDDPRSIVPEKGTAETIREEVARCSPELAATPLKVRFASKNPFPPS